MANRLVTVHHEMNYEYWLKNYARDKIIPTICDFINANSECLYRIGEKDTARFATPRSWTMLSNYIEHKFGKDSEPKVWLKHLEKNGYDFVGSTVLKLIKYVKEMDVFNLQDVLDNYPKIKKKKKKAGRAKLDSLIASMKERKLVKLKIAEVKNLVAFLLDNKENQDCVAGYCNHVIMELTDEEFSNKKVTYFKEQMKEYAFIIADSNEIKLD